MRQSAGRVLLALMCILFLNAIGGCGKKPSIATSTTGTIVCLTPAGTNLLVAMGLSDRIVAVSSYEADPLLRQKLPKVGDYERIDWERIAELKPGCLVVQGRLDRLPPGVRERCDAAGIVIAILQIDRYDDILTAAAQLGKALGADAAAVKLAEKIKAQMAALPKPATPTPALIVLNDSGTSVVGTGNYLNDLLIAAGGVNVITGAGFLQIDHEKMKSLAPRDVFLLMPGASEAMIDTAKKRIDVAAARNGHLHVISDANALLPGANVTLLASEFASGMSGQ